MLRFLVWRLLGLLAVLAGVALTAWFLGGGPGRALRGSAPAGGLGSSLAALGSGVVRHGRAIVSAWTDPAWLARSLLACVFVLAGGVLLTRWRARRRRSYVRLRVRAYRTDKATAQAVATMFATVQFLDGPRGDRGDGLGEDREDPTDGDGELAGAGVEGKDLAF